MYRAFFAPTEWSEERVQTIINEFNDIIPAMIGENYFSRNYGGKYFYHNTAKVVGYIRGKLQKLRPILTRWKNKKKHSISHIISPPLVDERSLFR